MADFITEMVGPLTRGVRFSPSFVDFNPAPQLSAVGMELFLASGPKEAKLAFPTDWAIASFRGQFGNQSVDEAKPKAQLVLRGLLPRGGANMDRIDGALVYTTWDTTAGGLLFDRFVADPNVIWPELERLLGEI